MVTPHLVDNPTLDCHILLSYICEIVIIWQNNGPNLTGSRVRRSSSETTPYEIIILGFEFLEAFLMFPYVCHALESRLKVVVTDDPKRMSWFWYMGTVSDSWCICASSYILQRKKQEKKACGDSIGSYNPRAAANCGAKTYENKKTRVLHL